MIEQWLGFRRHRRVGMHLQRIQENSDLHWDESLAGNSACTDSG
jgi:hypothetical protein